MNAMIYASGLVKRYGGVTALDGLDLEVPEGTVLALLGPNGAGKTTAVRILATLLVADEGVAQVAGIDVRAHPDGVRAQIGLSGQYAAVDEHLTGLENLEMVGRLYGYSRAVSRARAAELLEWFDLADAGRRPAKTYSGGMRRRLDLAGALVAAPPVLVLDEPTTGLDVTSRQQMWEVIQNLVSGGSTLLLTTQYLEEADRLADDILVIDHGRAIAHGTADELKAQTGGERIEIVLRSQADEPAARAALQKVASGRVQTDASGRQIGSVVEGGAGTLSLVLDLLRPIQAEVLEVGLRRPTLDDVFLSLTGHGAEEDDVDPGGASESGGAGTSGAEGGSARHTDSRSGTAREAVR